MDEISMEMDDILITELEEEIAFGCSGRILDCGGTACPGGSCTVAT